jgi:membrane-associated phospholipid phosphatase
MQNLNVKNFRVAMVLSIICAAIIFAASFLLGKNDFFLLLNNDLGSTADYFFWFSTYLGDGVLWLPILLYFISTKRKNLLPLLVSCFVFVTLFTQGFKLLINNGLRPTSAISGSVIHVISGVTVHSQASFPSGHTATAFVFYLIFCLIIKNRWWLFIGLFYALLVGYSRVYLAQHFPFDVAGGIVVALVSVILSVWIQALFEKRKIQ